MDTVGIEGRCLVSGGSPRGRPGSHGEADTPREPGVHPHRAPGRRGHHGILTAIAVPDLLGARRRANSSRAASETKTSVTQPIVYQNDLVKHRGALSTVRTTGYPNVPDLDPWMVTCVVLDLFADINDPPTTASSQVHVCSKGPTKSSPDCDSADPTGPPQRHSRWGDWLLDDLRSVAGERRAGTRWATPFSKAGGKPARPSRSSSEVRLPRNVGYNMPT